MVMSSPKPVTVPPRTVASTVATKSLLVIIGEYPSAFPSMVPRLHGSRRAQRASTSSEPSAERSERGTNLSREKLRLLPRGEVAALVDLVVVDEFGIRPLGPTPRGLILLARKDSHRHRYGDPLGVEKATLVFPIQTRRGDPRVRQPIKRDVVEEFVPCQFAGGARRPVQSRGDRRGWLAISVIVVEKPGGEADGRIRNAVEGLRARCHQPGVVDLL